MPIIRRARALLLLPFLLNAGGCGTPTLPDEPITAAAESYGIRIVNHTDLEACFVVMNMLSSYAPPLSCAAPVSSPALRAGGDVVVPWTQFPLYNEVHPSYLVSWRFADREGSGTVLVRTEGVVLQR